ncbi:MAG: hypothetical protein HC802_14150 [Caldilineaceae bacterium]|nr:hypothetical protein [Caldilineaceae bacterium]
MSIYIPENLTMVMKNAWWLMVLRGVMVLILGLMVLVQPEASIFILAQLIAAYLFVDGLFVAFGAIRHRASDPRWWLVMVRGLIGVAAGLFIVFNPVTTASTAIYLVGLLALVAGLLEIVVAIRIRKEVTNEWTMIAAG